MELSEFREYCAGMSTVIQQSPDWWRHAAAWVNDFIRGNSLFKRVLSELAGSAWEVLDKETESGGLDGSDGRLYELSAALEQTVPDGSRYRMTAYYFAVCVLAVALGKLRPEEVDVDALDPDELFSFDTTAAIAENGDPVRQKLERYRIRLLDFSRNNPLVHFREKKNGTLRFAAEIPGKIVRALCDRKKVYVDRWSGFPAEGIVRCKLCGRYGRVDLGEIRKGRYSAPCPVCDAENTHGRKSMSLLKQSLTVLPVDGFLCKCGGRIPSLADVCPVCGARPEIEGYPLIHEAALLKLKDSEVYSCAGDAETQEAAKTLINRDKGMQRNFGLNVLYLACGFLRWKDMNGTSYSSPILLMPVILSNDRSQGKICVEAAPGFSGELELNKTLVHMLKSYSPVCTIELPRYDGCGPEFYFGRILNAWKNGNEYVASVTAGWSIVNELAIGLFHYQKLQLENDLDVYRDEYLSHPVIRRLCGDGCELSPAPATDGLGFLVLDADSSQEDVIRAAGEGKSFILQGPPGSGKSQTITNMIACAIGSGKTVLFVTEKASARSVISENFEKLPIDGEHTLNDFVLDFEHFNRRGGAIGREPFVTELNASSGGEFTGGYFAETVLSDAEYYRGRVEGYMRDMSVTEGGVSYLDLLGRASPYAKYPVLRAFSSFRAWNGGVAELLTRLNRFYQLSSAGKIAFEYSADPLQGCLGDGTGELVRLSESYLSVMSALERARAHAEGFFGKPAGCSAMEIGLSKGALLAVCEILRLAGELLPFEVPRYRIEGGRFAPVPEIGGESKPFDLQTYAERRRAECERAETCAGAEIRKELSEKGAALSSARRKELLARAGKYSNALFRLFPGYSKLRAELFSLFRDPPAEQTYEVFRRYAEKLSEVDRWADLCESYAQGGREGDVDLDAALFYDPPTTAAGWETLARAVGRINRFFKEIGDLSESEKSAKRFFDGPSSARFFSAALRTAAEEAFLRKFTPEAYRGTMSEMEALRSEISELVGKEAVLSARLVSFFPSSVKENDLPEYSALRVLAETAVREGARLSAWKMFSEDLVWYDHTGAREILDELVRAKNTLEEARGRVYASYFRRRAETFVEQNGLTSVKTFSAAEHRHNLSSYAEADRTLIGTGARRLYQTLFERKREAGGGRFRSQTGYSVKRTIAEEWERIRAIKPCFMMSPLNVSQYLDISIKFDLVIFDEASQIFTEDALASIVRGKQVIIAGDSKQLPPCDFFRAGDVSQDYDDQYYEEEANGEGSVLNAADEALGDSSVSLAWHYRSCDESLIAFSNERFDYHLITFPSARRNRNDGIEYVEVPYTPGGCYQAGKGGKHINAGEADRIVALLYREMTHPERGEFSLGVVAFSNAQALEIEERWADFKEHGGHKAEIEAWEERHKSEPIIFCNLDTMQGDERDTMLVSICYGKDLNGRFVLPYLGRIRLPSGKKRLNVAITRARHRMIVVSTLDEFTLRTAIEKSSAPEDNKEGARVLLDFLTFARSAGAEGKNVTHPPKEGVCAAICEVLKEKGIPFDTGIGRSECRIDIGIVDPASPADYVLGILVDDPRRSDFDSAREYSRLTEQVLCGKYGWKLLRVYPEEWVYAYEEERARVLAAIRSALQ